MEMSDGTLENLGNAFMQILEFVFAEHSDPRVLTLDTSKTNVTFTGAYLDEDD